MHAQTNMNSSGRIIKLFLTLFKRPLTPRSWADETRETEWMTRRSNRAFALQFIKYNREIKRTCGFIALAKLLSKKEIIIQASRVSNYLRVLYVFHGDLTVFNRHSAQYPMSANLTYNTRLVAMAQLTADNLTHQSCMRKHGKCSRWSVTQCEFSLTTLKYVISFQRRQTHNRHGERQTATPMEWIHYLRLFMTFSHLTFEHIHTPHSSAHRQSICWENVAITHSYFVIWTFLFVLETPTQKGGPTKVNKNSKILIFVCVAGSDWVQTVNEDYWTITLHRATKRTVKWKYRKSIHKWVNNNKKKNVCWNE